MAPRGTRSALINLFVQELRRPVIDVPLFLSNHVLFIKNFSSKLFNKSRVSPRVSSLLRRFPISRIRVNTISFAIMNRWGIIFSCNDSITRTSFTRWFIEIGKWWKGRWWNGVNAVVRSFPVTRREKNNGRDVACDPSIYSTRFWNSIVNVEQTHLDIRWLVKCSNALGVNKVVMNSWGRVLTNCFVKWEGNDFG